MFNSLSVTLLIFIATTGAAFAAGRENAVKIQFEFNGATVVGSLDESAAANEFLAQLPMTVKLEDYGSTEKIAWLPTKLRRADSGASMTPRRGDIAYYAPWGNLAIFREDFRHSPGLISLGRIEEGLVALDQAGAETVTIRRY
ncbi:cyclophilin-like fold protein [Klebsiella michiganensis]|uniref:cyclophilin-like fold protein n=1 Tax=Klebsiella TaxID=570 RepID=UPI0004A85291|nr:cyclophilin-like fold protein [Klebsiella michiganensis]AID90320.1 cyclophilin [Klebsiella oxytoca KONIH1]AUV92256.1 cyclophilin [Klebsiella oxytoca]EMD5183711.1 cyclophilin [Klebsiella michiganensis]KLU42072.1 cyclophilin [Klebsiella michiganensis]KLU46351.1 cyclophilin [Klebsiella michiganensis]